ncbi:MAG: NUDIX domain-containing protein [Candidatus Aenigmarchaeota archaeon]|nr:NUDIX domain-containing protein [Candidatus Aenigmarchaeota archaeon]
MIIEKTVGAVIEKDGEILLIKRAHSPQKGLWCIPGGHVEKRESVHQAALREIAEEVGGAKLEKKPFLVHTHDVRIGHRHKAHVFRGKPIGNIRKSEESTEIGFFTLEQIAKMDVTEFSLKPINKLYPKANYDDYGRKLD